MTASGGHEVVSQRGDMGYCARCEEWHDLGDLRQGRVPNVQPDLVAWSEEDPDVLVADEQWALLGHELVGAQREVWELLSREARTLNPRTVVGVGLIADRGLARALLERDGLDHRALLRMLVLLADYELGTLSTFAEGWASELRAAVGS